MSERRERGRVTKRRGRGIGGKDEEGTLLISFALQPLNPGDATVSHFPQPSGAFASLHVVWTKWRDNVGCHFKVILSADIVGDIAGRQAMPYF